MQTKATAHTPIFVFLKRILEDQEAHDTGPPV